MTSASSLPPWKDKALFTPGPLTTSRSVKQAMLRDLGSRDNEFIALVRDIRQRLVVLAAPREHAAYTAVIMQGSGTFGVESVISSVIPPSGKLLVVENGAYGRRMKKIADVLHIETHTLSYHEDCPAVAADVERVLATDPQIGHVAVVHCETTTGLVNPVAEIGAVVRSHQRQYIVDAMSSFGAMPLDMVGSGIHYLISSANKCVEGVPGFSFIVARRDALLATRGCARSLSLDLLAQHEGLDGDGQFRFTPPVHALLAFHQALLELDAEGGVAGRAKRYLANYHALVAGMRVMGFREFLRPDDQGYIITAFHYPAHGNFSFRRFYERLGERSCVIYPGKLSDVDCFRIGTIGRIDVSDVRVLLAAIAETLAEMGIPVPIG